MAGPTWPGWTYLAGWTTKGAHGAQSLARLTGPTLLAGPTRLACSACTTRLVDWLARANAAHPLGSIGPTHAWSARFWLDCLSTALARPHGHCLIGLTGLTGLLGAWHTGHCLLLELDGCVSTAFFLLHTGVPTWLVYWVAYWMLARTDPWAARLVSTAGMRGP